MEEMGKLPLVDLFPTERSRRQMKPIATSNHSWYIKAKEMGKKERRKKKAKIYGGKNPECNYYVCCIDLRGLHCPQIEMAFTC